MSSFELFAAKEIVSIKKLKNYKKILKKSVDRTI